MTDATKRLEEIEAREKAATRGPWFTLGKPFCSDDHADLAIVAGSPDPHQGTIVADCDLNMEWTDGEDDPRIQEAEDAQFIAHARSDIPWLLEEIRKRDADQEKLLKEFNKIYAKVKDLEAEKSFLLESRNIDMELHQRSIDLKERYATALAAIARYPCAESPHSDYLICLADQALKGVL